MSLRSLLRRWEAVVAGSRLPQPPPYLGPDVRISRFVEHTGHVEAGTCFVARVRTGTDGHAYIGQAIASGASMILAQKSADECGLELPDDLVYLQVDDTALALAWLSAAWHDFPSRQLVMIGVTGTDGKTSTARIIHSLLQSAGLYSGVVSTLSATIGDESEPLALHVTTPEAPVVQEYLARMVAAGATHCIIESTSHALAQRRVDAIDFDIAVVTNITHEHLDYHGDFDSYREAKGRLFARLSEAGWTVPAAPHKRLVAKTAVLNRDDSSHDYLAALAAPATLRYSLSSVADLTASEVRFLSTGTQFNLRLPSLDEPLQINSALVGQFNVANSLAAAAVGHALGLDPDAIRRGLEGVAAIDGRMQPIDRGQPFMVIVDFAHTPNGLVNALTAARAMTSARLITVFGSAGKRDQAKRSIMASLSARQADLTILTAEDPRTDSLDEILESMAEGCRQEGAVEGESFWRVLDRGRAIFQACSLAEPGDLVLICGKGHEQSMCFGETEYPWDDRQAAGDILDAMMNGQQPPDLGLPTFAQIQDN